MMLVTVYCQNGLYLNGLEHKPFICLIVLIVVNYHGAWEECTGRLCEDEREDSPCSEHRGYQVRIRLQEVIQWCLTESKQRSRSFGSESRLTLLPTHTYTGRWGWRATRTASKSTLTMRGRRQVPSERVSQLKKCSRGKPPEHFHTCFLRIGSSISLLSASSCV